MNMQVLTPEDILRVLLKRMWWIIASVVVCVALGYVAAKYFPKIFRSTVIVTIDSPRIAKDYVKGLGQEAKFNEDPATLVMHQVSLALTNKSILMPIIETLKPYPNAESASPDQLMRQLRKAVTVGKAKDSVGVAMSYFNADPIMAQAVTALLAVKLQEDNINRRESLIATTTDFLSAELERMKGDLEVKEREISEFKRAHLGQLPQQMEANLRTLDRLQTDLTNSTDSLNKMGERLTALEKSIREFSELAPIRIVPVDQERRVGSAMPVDPRAARLRELKQKLSELLGAYKETYPDVMHVKEEIRRLESVPEVAASKLSVSEPGEAKADGGGSVVRKPTDPYLHELMKERSEVKSEIALLRDKRAHITRQIKELEARVEQTPASEQGLALLLRDYENMQKSYQAILDKRTNARILQNYEDRQLGEQYRIIEPANFPDGPEPPTQVHFLLGGLAVGCLIGFGSAIGVELLKVGFRRPEEVEGHLGLPVIASIPSFASVLSNIGAIQSPALLTGPGRLGDTTKDLPPYIGSPVRGASMNIGKRRSQNALENLSPKFHLITKWGPASLMAEQYRVAATRLILMTAQKKNMMTLVTSSVMGEGKTTTAVNLAYVLAHDLGKSTLLIDCDLNRPMVHEYMGVSPGRGLSDVIQGSENFENCLHRYDSLPLWILPSGSSGVRQASLLGLQYLKKILPEITTRYDHVILDGPPVMPLADTNILGDMVDMTVFVVCAGRTGQDVAKKALKALGKPNEAAGVILTQVEMEHAPYFSYAAAYTNEHNRI